MFEYRRHQESQARAREVAQAALFTAAVLLGALLLALVGCTAARRRHAPPPTPPLRAHPEPRAGGAQRPTVLRFTWEPTGEVVTQQVYAVAIVNGVPTAWATNRYTNAWELQERQPDGQWVGVAVATKPPVLVTNSATGTHLVRLRGWWR